jgi:CBS domain-containing protein
MKVIDLMTPYPHVVTPDESLLHAAQAMRDHDVGLIPVVQDRKSMKPIGVITDRDITIRHVAAAHHHDCAASAVMTRSKPASVRPTDDAADVIHRMKCEAVHRILVTDENDRLVGIVATADLLRHAEELGRARIENLFEALAQPNALPR